TTDDPDLHLMIGGVRSDPVAVEGGRYTFAFDAPPAGTLRLCSRSAVPSLLGVTRHDHRRLGVALSRLELRDAANRAELGCQSWVFATGGCHAPEDGFVWTDGDFALPAALFAHLRGPVTLVVDSERRGGLRYPVEAATAVKAA